MIGNDEILRFNYLFLLIEAVGLVLAFIELRLPTFSRKLAQLIRKLASQFQTAIEPTIKRFRSPILRKLVGSLVLLIVIGSAFQWSVDAFIGGNYFIALCFSGITIVSLCWMSVKWIASNPLGTLGVLLAIFGLIGNVYQVVYL